MFTPGNIIHAFFLSTNPPKPKYLISLFRSNDMCVLACFTTSKERAGVPLENIKHGKNKTAEGEVVSYVFLKDKVVGINPDTDVPFGFPLQTTVRFDYCIQNKNEKAFFKLMKDPVVVGKLYKEEYKNLIYSMYQSNDIQEGYKKCFEDILFQLSNDEEA